MAYPTVGKYVSAICRPEIAFTKQDGSILDHDLYNSQPVIHSTGMGSTPLCFPGGYACVFKCEHQLFNSFWAVRCFLQANQSVAAHYAKVSQRLKNIPCRQYFIDFQFQEEGIRIIDNNQIYPIVKMEWAEGDDLRTFISNNLSNHNKLTELANLWVTLSRELKKAGIAHGDIQHGNILIEDSANLKLKLVDYDSLYFSSDGNTIDNEIHGYPEYQHPLRSSLKKQCIEIDFFPQMVIYLSLKALMEDNSLWHTYNLANADRRLLFEPSDFIDPDNSSVCQHLLTLSPEIQKLTHTFIDLCKLTDFNQMPSLGEVIDQISTPQVWIPQQPPITQPIQHLPSPQISTPQVWTPQQPPITQPIQHLPSPQTSTPQVWTPQQPQSPILNTQTSKTNNSEDTSIAWLPSPHSTSQPQPANNSLKTQTIASSSNNSKIIQQYAKALQNWKVATISAITISVGLGGFSIWQYTQIEQLKRNIEHRSKNWLSLENSLRSEISTLKTDKSSLQSQTNSLNQKITDKQKEVERLNTEKQVLIDSRIDRFPISGKITSNNSRSNPVSHRLLIPRPSKLDVYLYDLASDADFDIVNERGQVLPNSDRTRSGNETEIMDSFSINSSGNYFVRVWLHSGSETTYSLRIYRYS
jgi:hypothetical protein